MFCIGLLKLVVAPFDVPFKTQESTHDNIYSVSCVRAPMIFYDGFHKVKPVLSHYINGFSTPHFPLRVFFFGAEEGIREVSLRV